MNRLKNKKVIAALVLAAVIVWTVWGNITVQATYITVTSHSLPKAFDGFKIAHISDLHDAKLGEDNEKLIRILKENHPDIIVLTGDMVDSKRTDIKATVSFVKQAMEVAPCFYVTGNHEGYLSKAEYSTLEQQLAALGVTVLHNSNVTLKQGGEKITVAGLDDPTFVKRMLENENRAITADKIENIFDGEAFVVLLSHRPELFEQYCKAGAELVLSGHAHGGQFRLPLIGGLVSPNQGFLPKYDAGLYTDGDTNMIVSRGVGNSAFPIRFNNPPEIIIAQLKS